MVCRGIVLEAGPGRAWFRALLLPSELNDDLPLLRCSSTELADDRGGSIGHAGSDQDETYKATQGKDHELLHGGSPIRWVFLVRRPTVFADLLRVAVSLIALSETVMARGT